MKIETCYSKLVISPMSDLTDYIRIEGKEYIDVRLDRITSEDFLHS